MYTREMGNMNEIIEKRVHQLYWDLDLNCARTMLICLGERFHIDIEEQAMNAAIGLHGAGGYGAQCGLAEGALMFLGIYFSKEGKTVGEISEICREFAGQFSERFSSLRCCELRPGGFTKEDPPHACEKLTVEAVLFASDFILKKI